MVGIKVHTLGMIGFGGMARYHFDHIQPDSYPRVHVKGIFDLAPSAQQAGHDRGAYVYSSKEELLQDPEIDLVLVATTNEAHKALSIEALRAGKNVICEKPATLSSAELAEIISVAEETGKVFTIDHNRRTNLDFVLAKRIIESGKIGEPYIIESRVEGSRGMPTGWRTLKNLGGGMMLDWGVHLIDQLLYLIPSAVTQVYCKMFSLQYPEVDDNFHLTLTFENGLVAIIEVGTNNFVTHPRWYVYGKNGSFKIDDWDCGGLLTYCINKEDVWDEEICYTRAGPTKTMAPRNENSTKSEILQAPEDAIDSITVVYDQFLDAVEGKAQLTITPQQAMRVMKTMEAAFASAKSGNSEKVVI